ncbi:uncharacterized protein LOC108222484 [Daucus carota subsp. sativus]|uniref:uncharacterized protein LOC108222484 n=1 Tax=Daucus carota subsp. sativus TaxID=79200 RepID=UPI0007F0355D|nr:PREDICTED: uncharacterized protein LOC108222484 [Daucus carota subsp. sativus]
MPSGPKKRRAQKKKIEEAAAARVNNENEATITASLKENSPVMEKESTDGVTVVLDEQNIGSPKRIVLRESKLASEVLEIKRKDSGEGNKENELLSEVYSDAQPLNVAEPVEKIHDDNNVVGKSFAVAAPSVIELDSEDENDDSMMSRVAFDLEGKETGGSIENPVPTETYSSVLVSESPDMDSAVISPTTKPCDQDLVAAKCSNAETAASNEVDASQKTEEAGQVDEVEAAMKNNAVSGYVNDTEESTLEAVVKDQETAAANEVDAPETEINQEAAIFEDVDDSESTIRDDVLREETKATPNNLESPVSSKPVVTYDAVSTELVSTRVGKELKEVKEMVEDVLNRLNAIDALLQMDFSV